MSSTETFQHYQVLKNADGSFCELGRGAMGVTYKAFDTSLRCHVALKVINNAYLDSEMAGQRFLREARAAAGLSHPNVASVFHLGEEGGNYFYAMEYINGETLESMIRRRGPLPPLTALKIALQVARALRAAARLGLVHRDIKPANLMLVREDEEDTNDDELHVKVIDFGLAKVMRKEGAEASATITVAGFVGTPHFASPEQLEEKDLDTRSDIYSLGVTLWYMLTGRPPFSGSMVQVMSQHLTRRPPFEQLPTLPMPALKVLERMLEKDPGQRPQTPSDLRREIEQAISSFGVTPPTYQEGFQPTDALLEKEKDESVATPTEIITDNALAVSKKLTASVPEPGVVLDGRYLLVRQVSQSERGVLFLATELDTRRSVALKILSPELLPNAVAYGKAQQEFSKAQTGPHPALLELFALARHGAQAFLAYEWVSGFPVVDVLRHRPVLSPHEILQVLRPVAAAADTLQAAEIDNGPEINSGKVLLSFGDTVGAASQAALLSTPFSAWPVFQPKIFPLRLQFEAGSSATWAGLQTIVPVQTTAPSSVVQLALLAYELLGGNPASFNSTRRYAPLPTLGERGNDILRETLLAANGAASKPSTAFVDELTEAIQPSGSGAETAYRPKAAAPPSAVMAFAQGHTSSAGTVSPPGMSTPASIPPAGVSAALPASLLPVPPAVSLIPASVPRGGIPLLAVVAGALALIALLGAIVYVGIGAGKRTFAQGATPGPRATPFRVDTPADTRPTPLAKVTPRVLPTPVFSTPKLNPTPLPPSRANRLSEAVAEAQRLQKNQQTAEAFAAYVRIAEEFPESDEGLGRIDSYISALRAEPLAQDFEQHRFEQLRPSMERAAKLGSDMAMLFLGDHLLTKEPETSADWFHRAADKGRPEAMLTLGDMYFRGIGVPYEPTQAARWYEMASDKGYVRAKINLAECYDLGKGGVQRNFDRAFQLLNEALVLEPNNPLALEKLAVAYETGHGTHPDSQKAFSLMKRASDQGNGYATANLGVYYAKGLGTPQNDRAALAMFKEGVAKNNPAAIYNYAKCLDAGLLGVPMNKAEAVNYFRASAERGFPKAMEYCLQQKISYVRKE